VLKGFFYSSKKLNCRFGYDTEFSKSKSDFFECISGQCIPKIQICNGIPDCEDGSDEALDICHNKVIIITA